MMMGRCLYLSLLALALLAIAPPPALAESWAPPETKIYMSQRKRARVTVTPGVIEGPPALSNAAAANGSAPAAQERSPRPATARLERRIGKHWDIVWERPLREPIAPSEVMVRDDGAYIVTFDNWYGAGYGPGIVAIYGKDGELVRGLALTDILPQDYIEILPHSFSSLFWRGAPRFSADGQAVIIPLTAPDEDLVNIVPGRVGTKVEVAVSLADGGVAPVDAAAWQMALVKAKQLRAAMVVREAARKAAFLAPLLGLGANTERAWHDYLTEAVARTMPPEPADGVSAGDPRVADFTAFTSVLRLPGAKDYAISERWIAEKFAEEWSDRIALASLSEPQLLVVLRKLAGKMPEGSLAKKTVFVAISAPLWPEVSAILQRTGATLVHLDPGKPIPQRPERIADRYPQ
jgi:hypothetical protein